LLKQLVDGRFFLPAQVRTLGKGLRAKARAAVDRELV
jgi:hypothetical protein